jgi:hypothetical protein
MTDFQIAATTLANDAQASGERTFSTGSRGFRSQGKVVIDGKRYQATMQLVEIGSKPKA